MINEIDFYTGQEIKVNQKYGHERKTKIIIGKVIDKNDFHVTIRTKNYNTSIMLVDFVDGSAVLLRGR